MRNRLLIGMAALGVLFVWAGQAGAVTDRNTSERGQMLPAPDTPAGMGHVNNMMQERMAAAGGPAERSVTAFAEDIVKTLPLIPGASVITYPVIAPSGNLFAGHGRGIGFASVSVHEPVTGRVIWATPRYLGPQDYLLQRTVGPGTYLGGYPGIVDEPGSQTNNYAMISDAHNVWAFDADSGDVKWVVSQDDWPAGPQRIREEPLRQRSMANDTSIAFPLLPAAIRAPSGEPVAGSLFTRGNFAYVDSLDGELIILQNGDVDNLAVGYKAPILYTIIDLLCFPGGQVSLEFKDFCSAFVYTRYYSVNTVMADPVRNRVTVTYAGDGATFDRFMTWEFITDGGPGQPGTIVPDPDLNDGVSPAMQLSWSTNFGFNSGATPTWSDSGAVIFGVDGAGITNAFDADTGSVLVSSTGGGAGFSPSTDHNDLLVICSPEAGLAQVSPVDGSFLFQNPATGLGLEHLAVMPDSPLLVEGRPAEECVGFPVTHPDIYQAQFVLGYPNALFSALAGLGIPVPSTITSGALADFQVDAQTGETIPTNFRSVYNGSGEASLGPMDSGRYVAGRVDAIAAIYAGVINLLLPRRFDVPPAESGFVISEPNSFRDSVLAQFEGAAQYCDEILNGRVGPAGNPIARGIPIVVAPPDQFNKERELQLAVNKVGYINSIMKNSVPGRISSARNDRSPAEIGDLEAALIVGNVADIIVAITVAREALLSNAPGNPDLGTQNNAKTLIEAACELVDETIDIIGRDVCEVDSDCDDGNSCTEDACVSTVCQNTPSEEGTICEDGGACDGAGNCVPRECEADADCETADVCTTATCDIGSGQCSAPIPDNEGGVCDADGNPGTCQSGACVGLCEDVDCPDTECSVGSCNPANGECVNTPANEGGQCTTGTGGEGTCEAGECVGVNLCDGVDCNDNNACTDNDCDPDTGLCINDPLPDGTACTSVDDTDGYCTELAGCVSELQIQDNSIECSPGAATIVIPFFTQSTLSGPPVSGGTVDLTLRIEETGIPSTVFTADPTLQQGLTLESANFVVAVQNGNPTQIALSDPNTPRPITGNFEIDTGDVVTAVTVTGAPGEILFTQTADAQLVASTLGGLITFTFGPGVDQCVITGGASTYPIIQ